MIRRATKEDIPGIMILLEEVLAVHHAGRPDIFKGEGTKYTSDQLALHLEDPAHCVFVDVSEGHVLAHCFCDIHDYPETTNTHAYKNLYIDDLCVSSQHRGEQIGKRMYEFVKNYARENGFYNLTLNVWSCNSGALAFYQKMGLVPLKYMMEQLL